MDFCSGKRRESLGKIEKIKNMYDGDFFPFSFSFLSLSVEEGGRRGGGKGGFKTPVF